jgi:hypothetical protein
MSFSFLTNKRSCFGLGIWLITSSISASSTLSTLSTPSAMIDNFWDEHAKGWHWYEDPNENTESNKNDEDNENNKKILLGNQNPLMQSK